MANPDVINLKNQNHIQNQALKLYTPNMVLIATMLGSLLAGGYLIWANYKALNEQQKASDTILWLCVGTPFVLVVNGLILPINFLLMVGLSLLAQKSQWKTQNPKASWWITLFIGILGSILNYILLIIIANFLWLTKFIQ